MGRIWKASVGAVFAAALLAGCGDSKQMKDLKVQVEEARDAATDPNQKVDDLETELDGTTSSPVRHLRSPRGALYPRVPPCMRHLAFPFTAGA